MSYCEKKLKVIIAGGRDFSNYKILKQTCDNILQNLTKIEIVSGAHYKGADKLGEQYAKERNYQLAKFPANWNTYGRAAGPKRNKQMANYADVLIAFWDGKSKGTSNMINEAKRANLSVTIIYYESQPIQI